MSSVNKNRKRIKGRRNDSPLPRNLGKKFFGYRIRSNDRMSSPKFPEGNTWGCRGTHKNLASRLRLERRSDDRRRDPPRRRKDRSICTSSISWSHGHELSSRNPLDWLVYLQPGRNPRVSEKAEDWIRTRPKHDISSRWKTGSSDPKHDTLED